MGKDAGASLRGTPEGATRVDCCWCVQSGITKLIRILEEEPGVEDFSANEYMQSYT